MEMRQQSAAKTQPDRILGARVVTPVHIEACEQLTSRSATV
jgi:hypothetical protein